MNWKTGLIVAGVLGAFAGLIAWLHGLKSSIPYVTATSTSFNSTKFWIATGGAQVTNDQNGLTMVNNGGGTQGAAGAVATFPGGELDNRTQQYYLHLSVDGLYNAKSLEVLVIEGNQSVPIDQSIDVSDGNTHDLTIPLPIDNNAGIQRLEFEFGQAQGDPVGAAIQILNATVNESATSPTGMASSSVSPRTVPISSDSSVVKPNSGQYILNPDLSPGTSPTRYVPLYSSPNTLNTGALVGTQERLNGALSVHSAITASQLTANASAEDHTVTAVPTH